MEVFYKKRRNAENILLIHVERLEAMQLIRSLAAQLATGCSNSGRAEHYTHDRKTYVSIAVGDSRVEAADASRKAKK